VAVSVSIVIAVVVVIAVMLPPLPILALFLLFAALVFHVLVVTLAFPLRVIRLFGRTVGLDIHTSTIRASDQERNRQYRPEERANSFLHVRILSI
jgi:hypothetical protein